MTIYTTISETREKIIINYRQILGQVRDTYIYLHIICNSNLNTARQ